MAPTPRVWVGCVHSNGNGKSIGAWIDIDELDAYDLTLPAPEDADEDNLMVYIHAQYGSTPDNQCTKLWCYGTKNIFPDKEMSVTQAIRYGNRYNECEWLDLDWELYRKYCDEASDDDADPQTVNDDHIGGYNTYDDFGYEDTVDNGLCGVLERNNVTAYFDFGSYGKDRASDYIQIDHDGQIHLFMYD